MNKSGEIKSRQASVIPITVAGCLNVVMPARFHRQTSASISTPMAGEIHKQAS